MRIGTSEKVCQNCFDTEPLNIFSTSRKLTPLIDNSCANRKERCQIQYISFLAVTVISTLHLYEIVFSELCFVESFFLHERFVRSYFL